MEEKVLVEIMESGLKASDWILIICTIVSAIVGIISVIIAVKAHELSAQAVQQTEIEIQRTEKDKQEALRGHIVISYDMIHYHSSNPPVGYFVIKNFGASSARITHLGYDSEIARNTKYSSAWIQEQFKRINQGLDLAPGEKIKVLYLPEEVNKKHFEYLFKITYETNGQIIDDKFLVNVNAHVGILRMKPIDKETPLINIAALLGELVERME